MLKLGWFVPSLVAALLAPAGPAVSATDVMYGPPRDVAAVRAEMQRDFRAECERYSSGSSSVRECVDQQAHVHDVTVVGAFALVSRGEVLTPYQTLLRRRQQRWSRRWDSGGDGFATAELLALGVPAANAAALIAHDRRATRAANPLSPEVRCIHTQVRSVEYYFPHERGSGASVRFFGRIYDPYFGTLEPAVIQRGYSALMQMRRGDRAQVCTVYTQKREKGSRCEPGRDPRGRWYRVFDYRLRRAFTAPNANHGCGGA